MPSPALRQPADRPASRIADFGRRFLSPVTDNPGFFTAATLAGAAIPWIFTITQGGKILWLMLFATVQSVALSYLLCLLVSLIGNHTVRRGVKTGLLIILGIPLLAEAGSITMTGVPLDIDSVNLLLETTPYEASGFFTQYLTTKAVCTILLIFAAIIALSFGLSLIIKRLKANRGGQQLRFPAAEAILAGVLAATVVFGGARLMTMLRPALFSDYRDLLLWVSQDPGNPVLIRTNQLRFGDPLTKWTYIYKDISLQNRNISLWEETQAKALASPCIPPEENDFDIIVIIGESFIRQHTPLYGYYLPTTPRLTEERDSGRLVVFDDMLTAANFTTTSLRNFLNLNDLSAGENWYDGVYFPLLVKKAGWNVYHYDNQTISRAADSGIAGVIYSPFNLAHTYDGVSDSLFTYDGDFASYVSRRLMPREKPGKKMVTYHLWGQHFAAADRFPGPPRFAVSDITSDHPWLDDSRRQAIADYDSATFYNDSVVGAIIDSRRDRPVILFYFSDHGEDSWELAPVEARNRPMPEDRDWLDRQYHIPFMVWMSDSLRCRYPAIEERIRAAAGRPGMLDNFGQMVLGTAGISTPYYRPGRDLTSEQYQPRPRVTSEGYRYDDSARRHCL